LLKDWTPGVLGIHAAGLELIDEFLRVLLLAAEDLIDTFLVRGALELGRVLHPELLVERDALLERESLPRPVYRSVRQLAVPPR